MTENDVVPNGREPAVASGTTGNNLIRIVIADDHTIFRDGLRKLLVMEDDLMVVGAAKDGREVLELLVQHRPDILLLDLKMPPGPDGLVILRRLQNSQVRTKVILLTACIEKTQIVQAMKFGACGIVLKETATEVLIEGIRKVYNGATWLETTVKAAATEQFCSRLDVTPSGSRNHNAVQLSPREREIAVLVAQGLRNRQMAERMFISEQTVKNHLYNIFQKVGVSDRVELSLYAIQKKLRIDGR